MNSKVCFICDKFPVIGKIGKRNLCRKHFSLGRICHTCDIFFVSSNEVIIYCSDFCTPKNTDEDGTARHFRAICPTCGKEFDRNNHSHKYCSKECVEAERKKTYILILDRDNYQCVYCGQSSYEDNVKLSLDHVIPRSKGGSNNASNIITTCRDCNSGKNAKIIKNVDLILTEIARRNKKGGISSSQKIKFPKRRYER